MVFKIKKKISKNDNASFLLVAGIMAIVLFMFIELLFFNLDSVPSPPNQDDIFGIFSNAVQWFGWFLSLDFEILTALQPFDLLIKIPIWGCIVAGIIALLPLT